MKPERAMLQTLIRLCGLDQIQRWLAEEQGEPPTVRVTEEHLARVDEVLLKHGRLRGHD